MMTRVYCVFSYCDEKLLEGVFESRAAAEKYIYWQKVPHYVSFVIETRRVRK